MILSSLVGYVTPNLRVRINDSHFNKSLYGDSKTVRIWENWIISKLLVENTDYPNFETILF